jgi:hypothetical protein
LASRSLISHSSAYIIGGSVEGAELAPSLEAGMLGLEVPHLQLLSLYYFSGSAGGAKLSPSVEAGMLGL